MVVESQVTIKTDRKRDLGRNRQPSRTPRNHSAEYEKLEF